MTGSRVLLNVAFAGGPASADGHAGAAQGGGVYAGGTLTLTSSTVGQNSADAESQGVDSVDTAHGFIDVPAAGGGVYAVCPLSLTASTLSEDSATAGVNEGSAGVGTAAGGGVAVLAASTVTGSTIDHDTATGGGGYYGDAGGAGDGGGVFASGAVTVTDSTIVDDTAAGGVPTRTNGKPAAGGGLYTAGGLTLAFSTVTGNAAAGGAGTRSKLTGTAAAGGLDAAGGGATLTDSVVSADTAAGAASDIAGTIAAASTGDLVGVGGGLTNGTHGNHVGVTDPILAALADNGGPTQTELPLAGSPAIDAGSAGSVAVPATDQRGLARVSGHAIDVGAVEVAAATTATLSGTVTAGGKGLAGATVYLDLNDDGQLDGSDPTRVTNATGGYAFAGLPAGTYVVRQVPPAGYAVTSPAAGRYTATLTTGAATALFADTAIATGKVTGVVFSDDNGDGTRDAGEGGKAGVTVFAHASGTAAPVAGEPAAVTAADGTFTLVDVPADTVVVRLVTAENLSQSDPASDAGVPVTVAAGGTAAGVTLGVVTYGGF